MGALQIFRSSRGVVDMGIGMLLAAASFHFISALVMNLVMPVLAMVSPGAQAEGMAKQHPALLSVNWGNLLQATLELLLSIVVS
ncbi:MAG: MscL family protein, partial [Candidatus Competibacteraceae bacterium]|nr:MscL family protein [Candidatus Competibacteraceae bacterium]